MTLLDLNYIISSLYLNEFVFFDHEVYFPLSRNMFISQLMILYVELTGENKDILRLEFNAFSYSNLYSHINSLQLL